MGAFSPFACAAADQVTFKLRQPPNTVSMSRPCAVVMSAHVSPRDLKPALRSAIVPRVLRRSRVDRAASPSARRRRLAAQVPWQDGRGRSWLRSPSRGTPSCTRPRQLPHLGVNALAVRGYLGVTVFHGFNMHLEYAPKRPFNFNDHILVNNY